MLRLPDRRGQASRPVPQTGARAGPFRRAKKPESHDGNEHGWAVSYVDLLMVLMSFFIMFFNIDSSSAAKQHDIMQQLSTAFRTSGMGGFGKRKSIAGDVKGIETGGAKNAGVDKGDGKGPGKGGPDAANPDEISSGPPTVIKELVKELQQRDPHLRVATSPLDPRGVAIDLPDDIYKIGEYHADWRVMGELDRVIKLIKPFQKEIRMVFVGHTDPLPITPGGRNSVVASNLVLSDLRASYAAGFVVEKGFDSARVSTQGFAEYARGTRSVSLHIFERAP